MHSTQKDCFMVSWGLSPEQEDQILTNFFLQKFFVSLIPKYFSGPILKKENWLQRDLFCKHV